MSTRHNYTNPAFCQQSEFYPSQSFKEQQQLNNLSNKISLDSSLLSINGGLNDGSTISSVGVRRIQRSMSTRSFGTSAIRKQNSINHSQMLINNSTPPRPGPKPISIQNFNKSFNSSNAFESTRSGSGRYALVPVEELENSNAAHRYTIVPSPSTQQQQNNQNIQSRKKIISSTKGVGSQRYAKSQDNIDRYSQVPVKDNNHSYNEENDKFTSLPPIISPTEEQPRMKAAFSSDFGSKSFVFFDHKKNQKYAIVPTADDEDLVDDNHEFIQMHNGRLHRYAVIPTEEEEDEEEDETCLSNSDLNQTYPNTQSSYALQPLQSSTPQKNPFKQQQRNDCNQRVQQQSKINSSTTPLKNADATRKLHELLSTPRKGSQPMLNITPTHVNRNELERNSKQYASGKRTFVHESEANVNQIKNHVLVPQQLKYEQDEIYQQQFRNKKQEKQQNKSNKQNQKNGNNCESRTTAVITPRVAITSNRSENYDEEDNIKPSWNASYPQKVANATATLGVVSLMLTLSSAMNTGLCLYLMANNGKTFYLQFALTAAFAGVGLGILGFRSRHCEWLPNRSYISGYILVTVFCLLKCCALLVLLALDPFPGIPLHDVTTGIVLGLSTFEIFFIALGVLGSWWCYRPPPDNRVNVY